jgi:hypothetical protein
VIGAERFLAEIQLTANLQHQHILPLFDSGKADSSLFYVMPYVEGESLRDRLTREKQLPVGRAADTVLGGAVPAPRAGSLLPVDGDDRRFVMLREGESAQESELIVALHWLDGLEGKGGK